ncbi:type II secretion system protein [Candidatus Nomurabacteria bacterium]|nr:type II secretion system protein [Candidatus Kaiserbacteria bacterium]MCB9814202.1 type II secretion system protein [Candidatus Nomurabacteria bacterium]
MKKFSVKSGFTLIEILVVITIIGILSVVIYANFGGARQVAVNKSFRSELKEMQLAIELYKSQYGKYPNAATGAPCGGSNPATNYADSTLCGLTDYITGLTPDYIPKLLSHESSSNPNCNIKYYVDKVNFSFYKLIAENCFAGATSPSNGIDQNDEFARCPSAPTCPVGGNCVPTAPVYYSSLAIYSPGAECM